MPYLGPGIARPADDFDYIKTDKLRLQGLPFQVGDGGAREAPAFPCIHGTGRPAEPFIAAGFNFDEHERIAVLRHNIDFIVPSCAHALRDEAVMLPPEQAGGFTLPPPAGFEVGRLISPPEQLFNPRFHGL
jgi:hypothetical protein